MSQYGVLRSASLVLVGAGLSHAAGIIDSENHWVWAENVGWLNWGTPGENGVQVLPDHIEGFIWGENIGWINLGNGAGPYANTDHTNFGVNIDPMTGALSGFAWGENIGWINFGTEATLEPSNLHARLDLAAQRFRGYAWGENIGWINLDHPEYFVEVVCPCPGDVTGDNQVDFSDLNTVLFGWGAMVGDFNYSEAADLDGSGVIDFADLNEVLDGWNSLACVFPCVS